MSFLDQYLLQLALYAVGCSCLAGTVAINRGRSFLVFFAFGFLFGLLGVIAALVVPRRSAAAAATAQSTTQATTLAGSQSGATAAVPPAPAVVHHHHHYYDADGREVASLVDAAGAEGRVDDGLTEGQRIARAAFDQPAKTAAKQPARPAVGNRPVPSRYDSPEKEPLTEGQRIARAAFSSQPAMINGKRPTRSR